MKNDKRIDKGRDVARRFLDITEEVCPLTFVKTKLMLERMRPGEVVEIRLNTGEPLENVPRSVRESGHEILSLQPEGEAPQGEAPQEESSEKGAGVYRLVVRRT